MFTLTPAQPLFAQQIPHIPASFVPMRLGESQSKADAARGRSTPPVPGSLGLLSNPCIPGMTWVIGSAHPVQKIHPMKLQLL